MLQLQVSTLVCTKRCTVRGVYVCILQCMSTRIQYCCTAVLLLLTVGGRAYHNIRYSSVAIAH
jgi:hypothetical protein